MTLETEPTTCVVCLEPLGDGISITSSVNQTVCEDCIEALFDVLQQVRARIDEHGIEGAAAIALRELDS